MPVLHEFLYPTLSSDLAKSSCIFFTAAAHDYEVPEDNLVAGPADEYDAEMNTVPLKTELELYASVDTDLYLYDEDEDEDSFLDCCDEVTYYFDSEMAADTEAVPEISSRSTGTGTVTVRSDGTVKLVLFWTLRGDDRLSYRNHLIGVHIHKGDENTNGPIVFGFCGQEPLPAFGGKCQQGWNSDSGQTGTQYDGEACTMHTKDCWYFGFTTAAKAAQAIIDSPEDMYLNLNIHTTNSYEDNNEKPLGLIRGQLRLKEKSQPVISGEHVTSTSREMKAALRGGNM